MSDEQPPQPSTRDEALKVWLKLVVLLIGLSAFGGVMFWLSRTFLARH